MIYLTSDPHGRFENICKLCKEKNVTENDLVIILGDACLNFTFGYNDLYGKRMLSEMPCEFLCVHGNHDYRVEKLSCYKQKKWLCSEIKNI